VLVHPPQPPRPLLRLAVVEGEVLRRRRSPARR
jgi:hypothetical protein